MSNIRRGLPLGWRLPLTIAVVLLLVIGAFTWIAWRGVRASAFDAIDQRLDGAVGRLAALVSQSATVVLANVDSTATAPAVVRLVEGGGDSSAVLETLRARIAATNTLMGIAVWDAQGRRRAAAGFEGPGGGGDLPTWVGRGRRTTGFARHDTLTIFGAAAPVRSDADTVGWAVHWFSSGSGGATATILRDLIGSDALYMIGVPGEGWIDGDTLRAGPDAEMADGVTFEGTVPGLGTRVGQARVVDPGDWWLWVGFPSDYVYARSNAFLNVMVWVAVVLTILGAVATWRISTRITGPLGRLRRAAEAIGGGKYSTRVDVTGDPELRTVAATFNHMAEEVEAGHHRLEERVAERTRELRDAQDELVKKERLAILGQLSSGVGHELRNPLGVMNNAVYFLQATLKDAPEKVRDYLGIIRHQITLSEKIVSDLLDFARIKEPDRARIPARELLETQLERAGVPEGVTVERDYPRDHQAVFVDRVQVGQVVLNLLVNAVQAMEGQGTLRVGIRRNGNGVIVWVRDTGPGITPAHQERIFEPLFTTKARGIGLGLAVSRGLAEANLGHLELEHTGPEGTQFAVFLPAAGDDQ